MATSGAKPRIILADDYPPMLEEVSKLLESEFEVVAAVSNGALAVTAVSNLKPDAALLDIHMPELGGIEAAQQLRDLGSSAKVIFLTIERDPEYVRIATALNAGYVVKSRMARDLSIAIREALAGRPFISSTQ